MNVRKFDGQKCVYNTLYKVHRCILLEMIRRVCICTEQSFSTKIADV